jgi:hypothetical protein
VLLGGEEEREQYKEKTVFIFHKNKIDHSARGNRVGVWVVVSV